MNIRTLTSFSILVLLLACPLLHGAELKVRVATFNTSLNRPQAGQLREELLRGDCLQAQQIAEVLQRVRPDIVLLNEVDYDSTGQVAASLIKTYLGQSQHGQMPLNFTYSFLAPVNTGVPSGIDLDGNGQTDGSGDAFGFGRFPGQYGMLILSRFKIDQAAARTFQNLLWKEMPQARLPTDPKTGASFYSAEAMKVFRLSSKSHWDVPIQIQSRTLHLLASHPTPPVFDGPEDRNGCRNHDEIRFWADFLGSRQDSYLVDDNGQRGGLPRRAAFIILGDLNSDPHDGDSVPGAVDQLLMHPRVNNGQTPGSKGAAAFATAGRNARHRGPAAHDTADFPDSNPGNLRVDYVLPSRNLKTMSSGVFWPTATEPGAELLTVSDHRLVWIDILLK